MRASHRILLAGLAVLLPIIAHAASDFALQRSIPLAGPVKWDYLTFEQGTNRLFAAEGDRVAVIDTATAKQIGMIAPIQGAHGTALAPRLDRGFATAGLAGTVTVFNLKTLKILKTIDVGPGPDAIAYDPATKRVLVPNEKSQTLFMIDAKTDTIVGRIPLHADPEFLVTDGRGTAYLNLNSTDRIAVIDTRTLKITRQIDVAPSCHGPTGLAIDTIHQRLFVSCRNHAVDVVDAKSGISLATLPIPAFCDAMRYDPAKNIAFAPSIDGTLTVIGAAGVSDYQIVQTVKTAPGARTMAFDRASETAYLSTATMTGMAPPTGERTYSRPVFAPGSFRILVVKDANRG